MAKKDLRAYLFDIISAINEIEKVANDFKIKDLELTNNKWFIERGISIIGEALFQANNIDANLPVTGIRKIIATRHIVVHDYDIIDSARLLIIIQRDLPILKKEVSTILSELDKESS